MPSGRVEPKRGEGNPVDQRRTSAETAKALSGRYRVRLSQRESEEQLSTLSGEVVLMRTVAAIGRGCRLPQRLYALAGCSLWL